MVTDEFAELVAKDVRNLCSEHEMSILESDTRGWLTELKSLKRDVEIQRVAQKAKMAKKQAEMLERDAPKHEWLTLVAEEDTWKVTVSRFAACVEDRIAHVKALKATENIKIMAA